jgi:hypothetical protein
MSLERNHAQQDVTTVPMRMACSGMQIPSGVKKSNY